MADGKYLSNSCKEISFQAPWGVITAKAWGPEDGKPFLGLHGWLDNANTFDKIAPLLPENIRLVAMDFQDMANLLIDGLECRISTSNMLLM